MLARARPADVAVLVSAMLALVCRARLGMAGVDGARVLALGEGRSPRSGSGWRPAGRWSVSAQRAGRGAVDRSGVLLVAAGGAWAVSGWVDPEAAGSVVFTLGLLLGPSGRRCSPMRASHSARFVVRVRVGGPRPGLRGEPAVPRPDPRPRLRSGRVRMPALPAEPHRRRRGPEPRQASIRAGIRHRRLIWALRGGRAHRCGRRLAGLRRCHEAGSPVDDRRRARGGRRGLAVRAGARVRVEHTGRDCALVDPVARADRHRGRGRGSRPPGSARSPLAGPARARSRLGAALRRPRARHSGDSSTTRRSRSSTRSMRASLVDATGRPAAPKALREGVDGVTREGSGGPPRPPRRPAGGRVTGRGRGRHHGASRWRTSGSRPARARLRELRASRARIVAAATPSGGGWSATSTTAPSSDRRAPIAGVARERARRTATGSSRRRRRRRAARSAAPSRTPRARDGIYPRRSRTTGSARPSRRSPRAHACRSAGGVPGGASRRRSRPPRTSSSPMAVGSAGLLRATRDALDRSADGSVDVAPTASTLDSIADLEDRVGALDGRLPSSRAPRRCGSARSPVRVVIADDECCCARASRGCWPRRARGRRPRPRPDALLRTVERARPDVAIIDIRMPPTHTDEGIVAAQEIRGRHPAVGVLVLSHYLDSRYAMRLLEEHPERAATCSRSASRTSPCSWTRSGASSRASA